jgi:GLPGLI family protein
VEYAIKLDKTTISSSNKKLMAAFEGHQFILKSNPNESLFTSNNSLLNDSSKEFMISKIYLKVNDIFYSNLNDNYSLNQKDIYGDTYLIKTPLKQEWKLINETKQIDNYICFKATKSILSESIKGNQKETLIEAWYAPSLNFSFGPYNFGQLPGLILELKKGNLIYYVTAIKHNRAESISIKKPSKGILISDAEFDLLSKKILLERKLRN